MVNAGLFFALLTAPYSALLTEGVNAKTPLFTGSSPFQSRTATSLCRSRHAIPAAYSPHCAWASASRSFLIVLRRTRRTTNLNLPLCFLHSSCSSLNLLSQFLRCLGVAVGAVGGTTLSLIIFRNPRADLGHARIVTRERLSPLLLAGIDPLISPPHGVDDDVRVKRERHHRVDDDIGVRERQQLDDDDIGVRDTTT